MSSNYKCETHGLEFAVFKVSARTKRTRQTFAPSHPRLTPTQCQCDCCCSIATFDCSGNVRRMNRSSRSTYQCCPLAQVLLFLQLSPSSSTTAIPATSVPGMGASNATGAGAGVCVQVGADPPYKILFIAGMIEEIVKLESSDLSSIILIDG